MSCYVRPRVSGLPVFFTVCLAHRGSSLLVDEVATLRRAVREVKADHPFEIVAFVVLPDHLHAVWRLPEGDRAYGVRWGAIKSKFSRAVLRKHGWPKTHVHVSEDGRIVARSRRPGFSPAHPTADLPHVASGEHAGLKPGLRPAKRELGVWQRRFWEHHIRDEASLAAHVRYCWGNPVKHGLVARAVDWPHSSIHRDVRLRRGEAEWAAPELKAGEP
ncbi:MAG: REP-associated tyrosine transposase [Shimia sp.]